MPEMIGKDFFTLAVKSTGGFTPCRQVAILSVNCHGLTKLLILCFGVVE